MSENSISSSELYKYPELITRSVNGYSFTQELVNAVNNFDFKKNAYLSLSGTNDNEYSYIWSALSNIVGSTSKYDSNNLSTDKGITYTENTPSLLHDDIARVFEDNIVNYIDNIANIDICKVKALLSMIQLLGVTYTIFDKVLLMPILLQNLLDVLSIKKEYLINDEKMQPLFALLLHEQISSFDNVDSSIFLSASSLTDCRITSVISTNNETYPLSNMLDKIDVSISSYIDDLKLYTFTSAVYKNILSDFCNLTYNNNLVKIYASLSTNILLSDFVLFNTNEDEVEELNIYRLKYNIPKEFNASEEFDKIEANVSSYDDYSIHEQHLLSAEYLYRCLPLSASALYSRYYYYRQRTVRDFFKFVENEYADYLSLYLSTSQYNIDNTYLVVNNNNNKTSLLDLSSYLLNEYMIDYVAMTLADITTAIRDVREQVKSQVLRNFLKGTKQHIKYLIQEYIRNNVYVTYLKLANNLSFDLSNIYDYEVSDVIININEYADPTEYFNISTAVDTLSDNVNFRFWNLNASTHALGPFNSNNLFKKPNIINSATMQSFTLSDVLHMYRQNLQIRFDTNLTLSTYEKDLNKLLSDFLDAVYDSGADNSYLDASGNICCNLDFINLNLLSYVKKISDLPLLNYEVAIKNISALYNSLSNNLGLTGTIDKCSNMLSSLSNIVVSSYVNNLSNITVDNYNDIITKTKTILEANGKTLDQLNITEASAHITEDDILWRKYKNDLFKKYTGLNVGSTSFYNIKNLRHASYLIHPYIKNFVDNNSFNFPIDNIANITSEKIMSLLVNDISSYIDDEGYLLNVWNSMLNTNSDYLTEYEKSSNKTPLGTTSQLVDYDGLFYPEALKEFITDYITFIEEITKVDENGRCKNKWYRDLNLSLFERDRIAKQLSVLYTCISSEAMSSHDIYRYGKDFYGNLYILTKSYSGVNEISDNFNINDATKLSTLGVIWMRLKNHPIAFPMIYNSFDSLNKDLKEISLIEYISDARTLMQSNTKFNELPYDKVASVAANDLNAVCINDFTISKDRTELFFLSLIQSTNELYVVHANIQKIYYKNPPDQRYKYFLVLDHFNNNLKGTDTTPGFDLNPPGNNLNKQYRFNKFYNFNNYVGVLAECAEIVKTGNLSTLVCHVYMPYWNKTELNGEQLDEKLLANLSCENCAADALEDYKIDITSTKRISIAYRNNLIPESGLSVRDYLGRLFNYPPSDNELNSLNIINNSISTKDWKFDAKLFIQDEYRLYVSYNDMGFVPIYKKGAIENNPYINRIYSDVESINKWYVDCFLKKGQLKINLVGSAATKSSNDHGIFFKHIVPARLHEGYRNKLSAIDNKLPSIADYKYNKVNAANYFDARYSEMSANKYLSSAMANIYDPYLFEQSIKNYDLSLRIDESYLNIFNDTEFKSRYAGMNITKAYLDLFNDVPYLYHCDEKQRKQYENYTELYNPGADGQKITANYQDEYVILLSSDDYISVSWIKSVDNIYGHGIKLDFNTAYYNSNPDILPSDTEPKRRNYFNWKHCFLNLDSPGDCGYLQIWHDADSDNNSKAIIPGNIYFIKNISDDKPRFLISLSGDFDRVVETNLLKLLINHENPLSDYALLVIDTDKNKYGVTIDIV